MRYGLTIFYFLALASLAYSQQTPIHSLSQYNLYRNNVAFAGFEDKLVFHANYRTQWQQIDRNPKQFYINGTLPMAIWNGGAGLSIESNQTGAESINSISISGNRFFDTPWIRLSAGASIGIAQLSIDQSLLITPDGEYTTGINHNDPILNNGKVSSMLPQYSVSAFASFSDFDLGVSLQNPFTANARLGNINYSQSRNVSLVGIYYLPLGNGYYLEPGLEIMSNFSQIQAKLFTTVKRGNVFGGVQLRGYSKQSIESIGINGGIKIDERYTISYNFDVLLNELRGVSDGTHEILFKYSIKKEINTGLPPKTMYSPRNL